MASVGLKYVSHSPLSPELHQSVFMNHNPFHTTLIAHLRFHRRDGVGVEKGVIIALLCLTFLTSHTGAPSQQRVFTALLRAEVFSVLLLNCHSVLFSYTQPFVISIAHTAALSSLQPSQGHCYYFNAVDGKEKERVECGRGRVRKGG